VFCISGIFFASLKQEKAKNLPARLRRPTKNYEGKNVFARKIVTLASAVTFLAPLSASADFIGPYDVGNWTITLNGIPPAGGSTIDTSGAPASITFLGGNSFCDSGPCTIDFTIAAAGSENVTFHWEYQTFDRDGPRFEVWGFLDGVFTKLSDSSGPNTQSGSESCFWSRRTISSAFGSIVRIALLARRTSPCPTLARLSLSPPLSPSLAWASPA
jgi:hypothetical protein